MTPITIFLALALIGIAVATMIRRIRGTVVGTLILWMVFTLGATWRVAILPIRRRSPIAFPN